METEGDPDGEDIRAIAFRLKPRTITINGIEFPAPFEAKVGDTFWCISMDTFNGYDCGKYAENMLIHFGKWRTEEEIKQVVAALRSIFKGE